MRESKSSYQRADIVIVTKCPEKIDKIKSKSLKDQLNIKPHQTLFYTTISYNSRLKGDCQQDISSLKKQKIFLVTGIADSSKFVNFFKKNEIDFDHYSFSDHHNYTQKEINKIENSGDNLVVTTEKDFQKIQFLERKNKWSYLEIEVKFLEKEDEFDNLFRKKISM